MWLVKSEEVNRGLYTTDFELHGNEKLLRAERSEFCPKSAESYSL